MFWSLSVILLLFIPHVVLNQQHLQNFGPYRYEIIKYETCKGPKRGECGTVQITDTRNMSNVPYVLDFPEDCPVTKAKITIGTIQKDNKTKSMWNYQVNKPCHHFVLGPLITKLFNLTQNCIIEKGHYEVSINMNELSTNFLGSYFFYDTYFFKTVAHNNEKNFFCVYSVIKIYKS